MYPSIIKRLDLTAAEYLSDLVGSGRRFVYPTAGASRDQVLSECERHEFAGCLLNENIKTHDIGDIMNEMVEIGNYELVQLMATYCMTNSPTNGDKVLDGILSVVVKYFADDMQMLIDNEWERRDAKVMEDQGFIQVRCRETGEFIWRK